jgi:branched-chain amino acid transport system substrate-binding protein
MKMEALTSFMKDQPQVKKVYLINQNYSHGQQVAKYFKEGFARKRPDAQVVGEDLHPLGQVKDFSPYVAKIKQSGADTVVTGNWGQDMTLLVKAINDAGLKVAIYAYYATVSGTPTALASGSADKDVSQIGVAHSNFTGDLGKLRNEFKAKFNDDFYTFQTYSGIALLSAGMAKAKSTRCVSSTISCSKRFTSASGPRPPPKILIAKRTPATTLMWSSKSNPMWPAPPRVVR